MLDVLFCVKDDLIRSWKKNQRIYGSHTCLQSAIFNPPPFKKEKTECKVTFLVRDKTQ